MTITFPGGKRVAAEYKGFEILTDQPQKAGGDGAAPAPFDLFLASLATCAGYYLLEFCHQRHLATEGLALRQWMERDPETRAIQAVKQEITLPPHFPAKYETAALRAAAACTVKKLIADAPPIEQVLVAGQPSGNA